MEIVKEEFNVRSFDDRRRRVNRLIVSTIKNGQEFRKRYEFDTKMSFDEMVLTLKG